MTSETQTATATATGTHEIASLEPHGPIDFPVRRIAVFRALVLGDLLCSVPALRAIKARWPDAELTLVGLPWARDWAARLPFIDRFEEFPGFPGLPERVPDLAAFPLFIQRMQALDFDLAVQMHGSGGIVNRLVASFGAKHCAGFFESGDFAGEPALQVPWPVAGHEILRMLSLTDHLGIARAGMHLEFHVTAADRAALSTAWPAWSLASRYVCIHAGAQLPSRRWMPDSFAAVADQLALQGLRIVLTGTADEVGIAKQVQGAMHAKAVNLVGKTSLWSLGALVEKAALVVSNDTGIMHVAAALGTPSLAIASGSDVARWAPLDSFRHRVLWRETGCRPCAFATCPYDHECARGVQPADVIAAARAALGLDARPRSASPEWTHGPFANQEPRTDSWDDRCVS